MRELGSVRLHKLKIIEFEKAINKMEIFVYEVNIKLD